MEDERTNPTTTLPMPDSMEEKRCIEEKMTNPDIDLSSDGVSRSIRTVPPTDLVLKIESFSQLSDMLKKLGVVKYQSGIFQAGGYKWRLSLYPDGDKKKNGNGHISLYLVLAEENNTLPLGWEVNVNFKLFIHDQIRNKYMTVQDLRGKVKRFHQMKTEHGFAKLISLSTFRDDSYGYLVNDTCMFGAEVFVIQNKRKPQCLSMLVNLQPHMGPQISYSFNNFSKLHKERYYSNVLSVGGRKWVYEIYPKGDKLHRGSLSLYLHLVPDSAAASFGFGFGFNFLRWFQREKVSNYPDEQEGFYVLFRIRVRDQLDMHHQEKADYQLLDGKWCSIGYGDFMSLSDLNDQSNGYLMNDTLIIDVIYDVLCEVKNT